MLISWSGASLIIVRNDTGSYFRKNCSAWTLKHCHHQSHANIVLASELSPTCVQVHLHEIKRIAPEPRGTTLNFSDRPLGHKVSLFDWRPRLFTEPSRKVPSEAAEVNKCLHCSTWPSQPAPLCAVTSKTFVCLEVFSWSLEFYQHANDVVALTIIHFFF